MAMTGFSFSNSGQSIIGRDRSGRPIFGTSPTSEAARTGTQTQDTVSNTKTTENVVQNLVEQIKQQQTRTWQEQIAESMREVVSRGDPASNAALQSLIQILLGGGTPEMKAQQAARQEEIQRARLGVADFSKAAAFSDSAAAGQAASRQALEQALGNINRAVAGAGTSGGSMQALLAQQAARDAQELQAKLQLEAAGQYGQIGAQYQGILEALTRPDNAATDALLQALTLAMQANQSTTRNTTTNRTGQELTDSVTNRTQDTTTNKTGTQDTTQNVKSVTVNPLQSASLGGGRGVIGGGGGDDSARRKAESDAFWKRPFGGSSDILGWSGPGSAGIGVDIGSSFWSPVGSITDLAGNGSMSSSSSPLYSDGTHT